MPGIKKTMEEYKEGKLKSSSGQKVTNRKQAIAIGLSEERKEMGSKAMALKGIDNARRGSKGRRGK